MPERLLRVYILLMLLQLCINGLDAHVADGLARVGNRVGTELHVLVFDDLVAQEVAEGVVFIVEGESRVLSIAYYL